MRYFAMIDGQRHGPLELDQLIEAGVRPSTYVWCKGMDDWEKAEDVADICRYFRQHIFDMMHPAKRYENPSQNHPGMNSEMNAVANDSMTDVPVRFREFIRKAGGDPDDWQQMQEDTSRPPFPTLFLSVMMTLFCFPITGMVAVYYSYKARVTWQESMRSQSESSSPLYSRDEKENLRRKAHDYGRRAKMWIGITFFLSIILYAFVGHQSF